MLVVKRTEKISFFLSRKNVELYIYLYNEFEIEFKITRNEFKLQKLHLSKHFETPKLRNLNRQH